MRLVGEAKYGRYSDDFPNVHPEVLERYGDAGMYSSQLAWNQVMNTHIPDDLDLAIAGDQDRHIRHEAIGVVENQCPFASAEATAIFSSALKDVQSAGIIPQHFGVAENEWEGSFYGETETVKVGRKEVQIALPFGIWWPRAVAWAQALEVMVNIQANEIII